MKIDFLGQRSALLKMLTKPQGTTLTRPEGTQDFGKLLKDIDPSYKKVEQKQELAPKMEAPELEQIVLERGPMARYNFATPDLLEPLHNESQFPEINQLTDSTSVNPPTVVSIKRRPSSSMLADSLAALPKNKRVKAVADMVMKEGASRGIDPALGMAVVAAESSFNPKAISSDGHFSKGLFQLLDSTAKNIMERDGLVGSYIPFDPAQNVELGTRYLRYLHEVFKTGKELPNNLRPVATANSAELEKLAVAAYNAGEGRVASAQARAAAAGLEADNYSHVSRYLPKSTQEYVARVFKFKPQFEADLEGSAGS